MCTGTRVPRKTGSPPRISGSLTTSWRARRNPILGNEDVRVVDGLFDQARALAKNVAASAVDPPEFAAWLEILRDEPRGRLLEWEDTLHAVTDYFGLSTDK
jgi:hypothetical protein